MSHPIVSFVTTNKHKFEEVADVLKNYPVTLEHLDQSYPEDHDAGMAQIAAAAAKNLSRELNKPIILEDTGLFFETYPGFPGALPKFIFNTLGYKGIFKLLKNENRAAYFETVAAYCQPNQEPQLFSGKMAGVITEEVFDEDKDAMPYDRIFIPKGEDVTISSMSMTQKNSFSQRAQAFRAFGEYIQNQA
jgi:XTP/dITP diphosphohydrolase